LPLGIRGNTSFRHIATAQPVKIKLKNGRTCTLGRFGCGYYFRFAFKKTAIDIIRLPGDADAALEELLKQKIDISRVGMWRYDGNLYSRESREAKIFEDSVKTGIPPAIMVLVGENNAQPT